MPSECGGSCCGAGKSDRATGVRHLPNWVLATNRNPTNSISTSIFTQYRYTRFSLPMLYINDLSREVSIFVPCSWSPARNSIAGVPIRKRRTSSAVTSTIRHLEVLYLRNKHHRFPHQQTSKSFPGTNNGGIKNQQLIRLVQTPASLSSPTARIRQRSFVPNNVAPGLHALLVQRTFYICRGSTQRLCFYRVTYLHLEDLGHHQT